MLWSKEKIAALAVASLDFHLPLHELFSHRTLQSLEAGGYIHKDKDKLTKVGKVKLAELVAFAENKIP